MELGIIYNLQYNLAFLSFALSEEDIKSNTSEIDKIGHKNNVAEWQFHFTFNIKVIAPPLGTQS